MLSRTKSVVAVRISPPAAPRRTSEETTRARTTTGARRARSASESGRYVAAERNAKAPETARSAAAEDESRARRPVSGMGPPGRRRSRRFGFWRDDFSGRRGICPPAGHFHTSLTGLPPAEAIRYIRRRRGHSSVVERQLPKLDVAGSTPVARSTHVAFAALRLPPREPPPSLRSGDYSRGERMLLLGL